jgi:hypothetical protein
MGERDIDQIDDTKIVDPQKTPRTIGRGVFSWVKAEPAISGPSP